MGFLDRFKRDRPMSEAELDQPSQVDGILYRDLQVVGAMAEQGADLRAPRHTTFYLYFPSEDAAAAAARDPRFEWLQVSTPGPNAEYHAEHPEEPVAWPVIVDSHGRALIPDFLRDTTAACRAIALEYGGEFDGWEAGVDEE